MDFKTLWTRNGFTLVEVLIVVGVLALISGISILGLAGLGNIKALDLAAQELVANLRDAQRRAITQEKSSQWGIHIGAVDGDRDFYEIFQGASYSADKAVSRTALSPKVEFTTPAQGETKDIIFSKITGYPDTEHIIVLALSNDSSITRTVRVIAISGKGLISLDETASAATAPTGLTAVGGVGQVVLNWNAPISDGGSDITNYKIYRGTISNGETFLATIGNFLTYTDSSPNIPSNYYKVSAVNAIRESSLSNEASFSFSPPTAPQNLVATGGLNKIDLAWQAPSSSGDFIITNYKIYRGTFSGGENYLTTIGNILAYTDNGLVNGTTYYYKVSAVNAAGEGSLSNEHSSIPYIPPSAPLNLAAADGYNPESNTILITLDWQAPSSQGSGPVTNYKIYRGTTSGGETLLTTIGNVLTYIDGVAEGTTYFYKISAVNSFGPIGGDFSNEAFDTTKTWQNLDEFTAGNWGESCVAWLTRRGRAGLARRTTEYGGAQIHFNKCVYYHNNGLFYYYAPSSDTIAPEFPGEAINPTYYGNSATCHDCYTQSLR